ncbi:type II secretion system F family protein [Candidatus Parcubacteria bacterium]|nr:type II secretion system F family protein [Candidatus Parcubacteria bacterium]
MPIYKYKALKDKNKSISGFVEANSEAIAADVIREKGLVVISLVEQKHRGIKNIDLFLQRVGTKELVIFTRQFSVLISASVALVNALRLLVEQTDNKKFKMIILEIADDVDNGERLSDALEKKKDIFSSFYISIVRSGETSGKLDEVLNYLADELEKDYDMTSKIKGAMIYPIFVIVAMLIIGVLMMIFVVPELTKMLDLNGAELPITTKIMVAASDFLIAFWWLVLVVVVAVIVLTRMFFKSPTGRKICDHVLLKLPIFGKLFSRIYLVRFTRSMSTLLVGGVTINKALGIAGDVVSNDVYRTIILETRTKIEDGASISSVFIDHKEVPRMVSHMIGVGEKTGRLDTVLGRITDFYSREINNITDNLMSLMEPVIMIVMGLSVGFMVASIFMPMLQVTQSF